MLRKIILASTSPRRKELMEQMNLKVVVEKSEYEEDMTAYGDPIKLVKFLAFKKTEAVAKKHKNAIVIGADTFIVFKGKFLGKPKTKIEAKKMLENLSKNECSVVTGFCVVDTKSKKTVNDYDEAIVKFRKISESEIKSYIATKKPFDCAGAFGIQDESAVFIERIEGSYHTILGLPIAKIYKILRLMNVKVF